MEYQISIGERIRKARKNKNLTLAAISEYTGLSTGNLSELENNKFMPSANALMTLSKLLGVSIDWLLTGDLNVPVLYSGLDDHKIRENKVLKESGGSVYILNEEESKLIESFRKVGEENRRDILGYINVCLSNSNKNFDLHI